MLLHDSNDNWNVDDDELHCYRFFSYNEIFESLDMSQVVKLFFFFWITQSTYLVTSMQRFYCRCKYLFIVFLWVVAMNHSFLFVTLFRWLRLSWVELINLIKNVIKLSLCMCLIFLFLCVSPSLFLDLGKL